MVGRPSLSALILLMSYVKPECEIRNEDKGLGIYWPLVPNPNLFPFSPFNLFPFYPILEKCLTGLFRNSPPA